ncbi:hypothetical protein M9458_017296, partial [Cirrhinus mrigala]
CILADYLLGRAGERFVLAQFDGQSPVTVLPEFFRELPFLDFIMELTQGARKGQKVSERAASQAVSRALRGPAGPTGHTLGRRKPGKLSRYRAALHTKTSTEGW